MNLPQPRELASALLPVLCALLSWFVPPRTPVPSSTSETKPALRETTPAAGSFSLTPAFEENLGQHDSRVQFCSRGPGWRVFLTRDEVVFDLPLSRSSSAQTVESPDGRQLRNPQVYAGHWAVRMKLLNSNPRPLIEGLEQTPARTHYFRGRSPAAWRSNVPLYAKVRYREVYPGVDLVCYHRDQRFEYDLLLQPGADADQVRLRFDGVERAELDAGRLLLRSGHQEAWFDPPRVWQALDEGAAPPTAEYALLDERTVGFKVSNRDPNRPLVVDPAFVYSTYYGGRYAEECWDMAVDSAGNAFVVGQTGSFDFPVTAGVFQDSKKTVDSASLDAFVFKLNNGGQPVYSTFLGGTKSDIAYGVAIDSAGNAYVSGTTASTDFPTTAGAYRSWAEFTHSVFVTKLDSAGAALLYSTYMGGSNETMTPRIALTSAGNAVVTGATREAFFPRVNAYQTTHQGGRDAFVSKLNPAGSGLVFSTYLGGAGDDFGNSVAVDGNGNVWVVGSTSAGSFPLKDPLRSTFAGPTEAFAAKFGPDGSFLFSTLLGGRANDRAADVAIGPNGNPCLTGTTTSPDFPTTPGAASTRVAQGADTAFVTQIRADGAGLVYSTYFGGRRSRTFGVGIALDGAGNAHLAGDVIGADLPLAEPVQIAWGGCVNSYTANLPDAFVAKLNPAGTSILFSSYVGGSSWDSGRAVGVDGRGAIFAVGATESAACFPVTDGAFQRTAPFSRNVFVSRIDPAPYVGNLMGPTAAAWTRSPRVDVNRDGAPQPEDEPIGFVRDGDHLRLLTPRWPGSGERLSLTMSNPHPLTGAYQTLTRHRITYAWGGAPQRIQTLILDLDGYDSNLRPISATVTQVVDNAAGGGARTVTTKTGRGVLSDSNQDGLYESATVRLPDNSEVVINLVLVDINQDGRGDYLTIPWTVARLLELVSDTEPPVLIPLGDTNGDGFPDAPAFDFDQDGQPDPGLPMAPFLGGPANPTVEHKLYFAHFADGANAVDSQIMLMNLDRSAPVVGRMLLRTGAGTPLTVDLNGVDVTGELNFTIPAGGLAVFRTDRRGPLRTGSVEVITNKPTTGVILFGGTIGLAGVGSSAAQPGGFAAPVERVFRQTNTGVAMMNLESFPITVDFQLCRRDNSVIARVTGFPLAAKGHGALYLSEFTWAPAVDWNTFDQGILRALSTGRVAALLLTTREAPAELATLPVSPHWREPMAGVRMPVVHASSPLIHLLYFPQFGDGAGLGWRLASKFMLLNLDPWIAAKSKIQVRTDSGSPMTVDLNGVNVVGEADFEIPIGGSAVVTTDAQGAVQVGSAVVSSDRPVAGVILYDSVGTAGVGSCGSLGRGFVAAIETNAANGVSTGLAVMDLDGAASTVDCELVNEAGTSRATASLSVAANGHMARMLEEFGWSPPIDLRNFRGTLWATASTRVAATVIRTQVAQGQYATLPVAPRLN